MEKLLLLEKCSFIITQCDQQSTFIDILSNAFDKLDKFQINEKTTTNSSKLSSSTEAEIALVKDNFKIDRSETQGEKVVRLLPPQLSKQKLACFLGKRYLIWIIEDFHKMASTDRIALADTLKTFVDAANDYKFTKIICIGAMDPASQLLEMDANLKGRISEIHVELLSDQHIGEIIVNGCHLLNIKCLIH